MFYWSQIIRLSPQGQDLKKSKLVLIMLFVFNIIVTDKYLSIAKSARCSWIYIFLLKAFKICLS